MVVREGESEKVTEWKRERAEEKGVGAFLNSLRGTPNPLTSTNQLTDCHLPRSRWGWGTRAYNSLH